MPPNKLVFSKPSITTSNSETVCTKAYALKIQKQDHATATEVLSKEPFGNLRILPGQVRHMNPRAYANGLKLQNQHIHDRYIVPVTGITEAMMLHMQPHLKDIKGVHDVFPTQQTQALGRWNVIVDKALFASTRHEIEKALLAITAKVSANVIHQHNLLPFLPFKLGQAMHPPLTPLICRQVHGASRQLK